AAEFGGVTAEDGVPHGRLSEVDDATPPAGEVVAAEVEADGGVAGQSTATDDQAAAVVDAAADLGGVAGPGAALLDGGRTGGVVETAAAHGGGVAGDGAGAGRERARKVHDGAASVAAGGVAGQGAVADRQGADVPDAAAVMEGGVILPRLGIFLKIGANE